jgi:hypothetical protein
VSWRPGTPPWLIRAGLLVLALPSAVIAGWGLIAPSNFYDSFPGAGRHWVSALPPYNEHLLRDFSAASLAIVVFLVGAAILLERRVIQVALIAFLAYSIPHFAYHATTTEHYSTGDNLGSLGGFVVTMAISLGLLALTRVQGQASAAASSPGSVIGRRQAKRSHT